MNLYTEIEYTHIRKYLWVYISQKASGIGSHKGTLVTLCTKHHVIEQADNSCRDTDIVKQLGII